MSCLTKCTKCVIPETHETITFDENGVCKICEQQEYKNSKIDWNSKKKELDELIAKYRDKGDYDCLIPFSGGKDSTWTLYYLIKEYNIKPLVVRFNHGFMRPTVSKNTIKALRKLGADFLDFTPNWKVVQKLMLQSFLEKGDFCWHCHTGIFAYPMQMAIRFQVPLIFWGEPSAEYTSYYNYEQPEEVDEKRFNRFINLGISADDMYVRLKGEVSKRELKPFAYPALKDLRKLGYRSVCLGSYIPWEVPKQSKIIMDELGWEGSLVENVPPQYQYEKIECHFQGVRDYIKYIKRGYSRTSHLTSLDIRNNRMDRNTALEMVKEYEGKRPPSLDLFLDFIGLSEEEFFEVAMSHIISPHTYTPNTVEKGQLLPDSDEWVKTGNMSRKYSEKKLNEWREKN